MNSELADVKSVNNLYNQIEEIIVTKRNKVTYQINNTMLETYFLIGKLIVENEQNGNIHAEYGKQILKELSSINLISAIENPALRSVEIFSRSFISSTEKKYALL